MEEWQLCSSAILFIDFLVIYLNRHQTIKKDRNGKVLFQLAKGFIGPSCLQK